MVDRLSRVSVLGVGRVIDQISGGRVPKGKEEREGERAKGMERILMDRNKREKEANVE
jgi:hypothetical protein